MPEKMPRRTRAPRSIWTIAAGASLPFALLGACGSPAEGDESLDIGSSPAPLGTVTGANLTNQHMREEAAETMLSTSSPSSLRHVMTYNAEDTPLVEYTNTNRFIHRNASLMGWTNWRPDGVKTQEGRLRPPPGWAVLWGDPAIARNSGNGNLLYISNLAVPDSKFPSGQEISGDINPMNLPSTMCGAYIGGACIARSTDDGQSFSLSSQDCLRRVDAGCPGGHFYDGGSIASSFAGRVYAAFNDVNRDRHDVYQAQSMTGSFQKITDYNVPVIFHPRLRYGRERQSGTDNGALYMLYQQASGAMGLARYDGGGTLNGAWFTATWTSPAIGTFNPVKLTDRNLRTQPDYDFDVGLNESGQPEIRIVYSVHDGSGLVHMNGASCVPNWPSLVCTPKGPLWSTTAMFGPTNQWNPTIAYGKNPGGGNTWQVSFLLSLQSSNLVELWRGTISNGGMGPMMRQETAQRACPDLRSYWGDYDNSVPGLFGQFYRGFSDSSHGNCARRQYFSAPNAASLSGWVAN
jgi:hypothetical protein